MKFTVTTIPGVMLIDPELNRDERGYFARTFCKSEFEAQGLKAGLVQGNVSFNRCRGTLRGMHYQAAPHEEAKIVRCVSGVIFDVVVDLREGSSTRHLWESFTLSSENRKMVYVPEGCAHGFQTLADNVEVAYQMTSKYVADAARGIRWNDPVIHIEWPVANPILSEKDRTFPLLRTA